MPITNKYFDVVCNDYVGKLIATDPRVCFGLAKLRGKKPQFFHLFLCLKIALLTA